VLGSALLVIALLTSTPLLSVPGFVFGIIPAIRSFALNFYAIINGWIPLALILNWIGGIVVYALLMVASLNPKSARNLGVVAAVAEVVKYASLLIWQWSEGYEASALSVLYVLLFLAGAVLWGFTWNGIGKKAIADNSPAKNDPTTTNSKIENGNVEKLLRLKELLDTGVLTEEEFDAKKKQLLNL